MRKIVLGVAAAATLLAAWFAPDQDGGVVGPAAATTREPAAAIAVAANGAGDSNGGGAGDASAPRADAAAGTATGAPNGAGPAIAGAAGGASGAATGGAPATQWLDLQIHPRVADEELGKLFAKQSWQPEAPRKVLPPQAAEAPPPARAAVQPGGAPPLPFQFMGRFVEDGKSAYFLQADGRNVVARPGEKIDDNYLLEGAANGALQFIYLPLNERQSLAVGDNN
jgi:hypothetical protein